MTKCYYCAKEATTDAWISGDVSIPICDRHYKMGYEKCEEEYEKIVVIAKICQKYFLGCNNDKPEMMYCMNVAKLIISEISQDK